MKENHFDVVVIGAGFYGSLISIYLNKYKNIKKILLLEKEPEIMNRSSSRNQARIHNGYHYPRSFMTANRSHLNFSRFVSDWISSVKKDFISTYAIARNNSKVSYNQFKIFCNKVGIPLNEAKQNIKNLFNMSLVSNVYLTEEYIFDANIFKMLVLNEINKTNINLQLSSEVKKISKESNNVVIETSTKDKNEVITSNYVFNCTYSSLNKINNIDYLTKNKLRHEIAEIALISPPPNLSEIGVTLMDGPFFSFLPFPSKSAHSISHVRYTPHTQWLDNIKIDPDDVLKNFKKKSNVDRMIRDASRYLPTINKSKHIESFFEIKTILSKNDNDDGRPILFEESEELKGLYSVLGGKLDNIYDILKKLDALFEKKSFI